MREVLEQEVLEQGEPSLEPVERGEDLEQGEDLERGEPWIRWNSPPLNHLF